MLITNKKWKHCEVQENEETVVVKYAIHVHHSPSSLIHMLMMLLKPLLMEIKKSTTMLSQVFVTVKHTVICICEKALCYHIS